MLTAYDVRVKTPYFIVLMNSGWNIKSKTGRRLVSAVAILLLVYTGIDMASPQLCGEELIGDVVISQSVSKRPVGTDLSARSVASIKSADDSQNNQPSDQTNADEDCFCCCSHILPGTIVINLAASDIKSPSIELIRLAILSPSLPSAYHPPRLA